MKTPSLPKKSSNMEFKLITNTQDIVQIDNINYAQLQGHQPPANTPMTPGPKSPWNNVIIDDSCELTWNENLYQFQDYLTQETKIPKANLNNYTRALLKEMMKIDFSKSQKVKHIQQIQFRQCSQEMNQFDFQNRQNHHHQEPQFLLQKSSLQQQPRIQQQQQKIYQQPQNYLARSVEDPLVKQKKQEMLQQQKWLAVQSQTGTKENEFQKELKFKLNQLAPQNYKLISQQILSIILQNTELQINSLEYIVEKGAVEDKYRVLYAQLIQQVLDKVQNPAQIKSTIKTFLINKLCPPDYGKIREDMKYLVENDKLIFQTKRKKKFIGYNKLIATLFKENIFNFHLVDEALIENIRSFVNQHNIKDKNAEQKRISEEPIEAVMALLQVCGRDYLTQAPTADWVKIIEQLSKNNLPQDIAHFSQEGIIQLIDCFINNYPITQRVNILLQNLRDEVSNKFSGQSIKSKKLQVESSDDEEYVTEQVKAQKQVKQQPTLKRIQEDEDEQLLSSKKPITEKDIILILDQCFKSQLDICVVLQAKLLNRMIQESHWQLFWKTFFNNLLDINPANMTRIQLPYKIFEPFKDFCPADVVIKELNEVLQEKVFDIVESPYGLEFLSKILRPFIINHFDCILQLKLQDEQEELQQFYIHLVARIVTQELLQSDANINTISEFFVNNLILSVEQQQTMWESIK